MNTPLAALDCITDKVVSYRPARKQPEAKKIKASSANKAKNATPKKGKRDV
ncbi:MAG: hypothetical protein ACKO1N_10845 [Erythrobacter sp.]